MTLEELKMKRAWRAGVVGKRNVLSAHKYPTETLRRAGTRARHCAMTHALPAKGGELPVIMPDWEPDPSKLPREHPDGTTD